MARRWPVADERRLDPAAEEELARAIAAVQGLRGWRDRVGAAPAAVLPARLEAEGYERTAAHVARLARCAWSADGAEPAATRGRAGRRGGRAALRRRRPRGRRPAARAAARRWCWPRSSARSASWATTASWPRRRRPWSRPSATSSRACARSSPRCELDARAGRGAPARPRAVRDALRAGAHAPPAHGARLAAGALLGGPRGGHERQELDRADDRRAARGARHARGRLPLPAPDLVRRAHPHRGRGPLPGRLRRRRRSAPPPRRPRWTARWPAASA